MTRSKQQYLAAIRANSAYLVYRGVISTVTLLFYLVAGVSALGTVVLGLSAMTYSFMAGVLAFLMGSVMAALYFFLARFFQEAFLILADIGSRLLRETRDLLSKRRRNFAAAFGGDCSSEPKGAGAVRR